jgi:hypothetical protein
MTEMTSSRFDIVTLARHFTVIGCLVIGMAMALPACSAVNVAKNEQSSSNFRDLELRFAQLKGAWLNADADLLDATCRRLTPVVRKRMVPVTSDFDVRKTACADVPALQIRVAKLLKAADAADGGAAFEAVQDSLEKERQTADATIQAFPTSSFPESNFPLGAASEFRAKHESEATDAGTIAAAAVEVARAASETALNQAKRSDHQLDKSRAEIADENYSKASVELKNLGSVTSAPQIVASVGDMLTTVDWVLGTAESTTSRETSPVSEAHEDLPTAATPVPVVVTAVTSSTSATQIQVATAVPTAAVTSAKGAESVLQGEWQIDEASLQNGRMVWSGDALLASGRTVVIDAHKDSIAGRSATQCERQTNLRAAFALGIAQQTVPFRETNCQGTISSGEIRVASFSRDDRSFSGSFWQAGVKLGDFTASKL